MRGAVKRLRRDRELVWVGAMLPYFKKPVTLEQFMGRPADDRDRVKRFHSVWDKIDKALRH